MEDDIKIGNLIVVLYKLNSNVIELPREGSVACPSVWLAAAN